MAFTAPESDLIKEEDTGFVAPESDLAAEPTAPKAVGFTAPESDLAAEEPSAGDIVKGVGTEVAAGIGGSLAGGVIGGALGSVVPVVGTAAGAVVGSMVGGATASFFGSLVAQEIEGQEERSMGRAIAAAAIGAVPGGVGKGVKGGLTVGKVIAREGAKGAAFGATEATARAVIDEGRLPTKEELAKYGGAGALFGGALGGVTSKVGQKFAGKTPKEIDRAVARGDIEFTDFKQILPKKKPIPEESWFSGSKIKTPEGEPIALYHGTKGSFKDLEPVEGAIFLTANPQEAARYAGNSGNIRPVYARIKNPASFRDLPEWKLSTHPNMIKELMDEGYDGMEISDGVFVAFDSKQVRSIYKNTKNVEEKLTGIGEKILRRSVEETKVKARAEAATEALAKPQKNLGTMGKILASVAPSKFVGTKAQQATIDFQRVVKAAEEVSSRVGVKAQRAIKKNPTLEGPVNKFLDSGEMSPEVYDVLGADLTKYDDARQALQREAIQLIDDGAYRSLDDEAREQLKQTITESMTGSQRYARREYQAFLNPEFKPSSQQRQAAKNELIASRVARGERFDAAEVGAEKHLEKLENSFASTRKEDPRRFFGSGVDSVFKKRHNPGQAEREYLGIVTDPVERMKGTLTGIARSVARERTNLILGKELVEAGVAQTSKLDDEMVELVLRGTGAEGSGLYGYPQAQTALNELYVGNGSEKMDNIFLNGLQDLYRAGVGLSKGVKVLLNTVAYPVQVYGNASSLIGMGINPFHKAGRGLRLALADAPLVSRALEGLENSPQSRRAILDELEDMARYGIKNANVLESDIRATLDSGPFSKWLQKGLDPFGKAYQVPDTLGRYVGWKANQNTLRKIFPSASEDVIKRQAASMINDTYQNYDKLSNVVRTLSRWGVMPQFASFTSEFMRNQYNQGKTIVRMLAGNFGQEFGELGAAKVGLMRAEGTKRLASLLAVYGGTYAAIEGVKAASGVDDRTEEDLRDLVYAPWDKDRSQLVKLDKDGKAGWIANPSYVVPHALGLSALKAGLNGDDEQSLVGLLTDEMVGEGSFVFQEAYRALANQTERGKNISNQLDDLKNAQERMAYFIQEAFKPGFSRELKKLQDARLGKGDLTLKEVGARQLGARLNPFNVKEAAMFTVRNTNDLAKAAKSQYTSTLKFKEPTPRELEAAYEQANGIHREAFAALRRNYESMLNPKFGFSEDEIIQTFKDGGLSSKRILEVITDTPTDLPRTTQKSTSELYNEMGKTMDAKRKNIQELMRSDRATGEKLLRVWERERRDKARGLSQKDILIRNMGVDDRVDFLSKNPGMIEEFRRKGMLSDDVVRALRIQGAM
jgi:hypothetical protein